MQYKFYLLILLVVLYSAAGRPDNRPEWSGGAGEDDRAERGRSR